MSEEHTWVRMLQRHGSPVNHAILNVGAVVRIPAHWADRWIENGIAVATDDPHAVKPVDKVDEEPKSEPGAVATGSKAKPAKPKKGGK